MFVSEQLFLVYFNFQPPEVVSHYCDPQPLVGNNYSYLFDLRRNICKPLYLNTHFVPNNSDLIGKKNDYREYRFKG